MRDRYEVTEPARLAAQPLVFGNVQASSSAIGLGCSRLGSTLNTGGQREATRLVSRALEIGVTLFDTADIYGQGDSERILGECLRGRRSDAVLVTKAGQRFSAVQRAAAMVKAPLRAAARVSPRLRTAIAARRAGVLPRDLSPAHLRRALKASLKRLRSDYVDAFLLHSPDAGELAPQSDELAELLDGFVRAGQTRCWGVSCDDVACLAAALRMPGEMTVVQVPLQALCSAGAVEYLGEIERRGITLLIRELGQYAGPLDDPERRRAGIARTLGFANAVALIGTTRIAHLEDAVATALSLTTVQRAQDQLAGAQA